jgi:hypothetical protein
MLTDIDEEVELSFLFTETPELYIPYGFRQVPEYYFLSSVIYEPGTHFFRKLDFFQERDLQMIRECFKNHQPISRRFAPLDYQASFYLNMHDPSFQQKLYYSESLDGVVVYEVDGGTLKLYDIIAEKIPDLKKLCSQIPEPFSKIEFYFCPDLFNINECHPTIMNNRNSLMVRGDFDLEGNYVKLPITAVF